ncbi:hypothetical protein [Mucilaginibacter sp. L3T2-6]|uniref:hypothetical protein n=1 Tax=Mucilaginibacter sp. L3T2-6 TaxID=3062491 RepID=UPI0026771C4E|nr:hypothetical protein [Mucilaginibacter sp. L3T2-6]MDO3640957.1 hypothetical protein [Mucilaginibacter sp. L3T2-6]MDV6213567.1 hypothetical protein [Mucilaginibacter sp. L3T2-6]
MDDQIIVEIPSFIQGKAAKRLTFTNKGLKIEKLNSFDPEVFIAAEKIAAFRFGVSAMRGYAFIIGRRHFIELKDLDGNVYKIQFTSYYGIRRDVYTKVWSEIITQLWNYYFRGICSGQFQLYKKLQVFDFAGIEFLYDGVRWDKKNKLLWHELALSRYRTYFTIHHHENPKQYKSFSFASDWNALLLQELLMQIITLIKDAE